ncbi:MAG: lytic murein transglycosylase B [Halothiobacillaceae bacterium]
MKNLNSWPARMVFGLVVALCALSVTGAARADFTEREGFDEFVSEAAAELQMPRSEVRAILSEAKYKQSIIDAITRPAESKTWAEYRPIFMTQRRIDNGLRFWDEHRDELEAIAADYGIPPQIIVAIIGVETAYGGYTGNYRVLDALMTLGFDYPRRAAFFRKQLVAFLALSQKEGVDVTAATGSYAGAMGLPQFIPTSYLDYAVDGDADGRRDLWSSQHDVFASVANYFASHGWEHEGAVAFPVTVADAEVDDLLNTGRDLKPKATLDELVERGVELPEHDLPGDTPVMLFTLTWPDRVEHWVGLNNFYVITRYNHSVLYAMAVWELSRALAAARE